jgi:hypothetical protein
MNRIHTCSITLQELNIIRDTLYNNEYKINLGMRHPNQHKCNINTDPQYHKIKWVTFTYSGEETKKITKLLKETNKKSILNTKQQQTY